MTQAFFGFDLAQPPSGPLPETVFDWRADWPGGKGKSMDWYNEPPMWTVHGSTITVKSGPKTDFWRTTHYGFIR